MLPLDEDNVVLETAFSDVPSGPKACSGFCRAPG